MFFSAGFYVGTIPPSHNKSTAQPAGNVSGFSVERFVAYASIFFQLG